MIAAYLAAAVPGHEDCEAIREGFLQQPANAVSSLAFLLAGAWILYRATRVSRERSELLVFGILVSSNTFGGFLYHGTPMPGGQWLHDVAALSLPLFVFVHDLGLVRGVTISRRLAWLAVSIAAVGAILAAWPGGLVALGLISAAAAGIAELSAYRAGYRPRWGSARASQVAAWALVLGALALGGLAFLLGRTGSPLCVPTSLFQAHAAWHILVAIATAAYAWAALELRGDAPIDSMPASTIAG